MGVEPTYQPWEGRILPMNYTRATDELYPRDRCIIAEAAGDCNRFLSQFPAAPEKI